MEQKALLEQVAVIIPAYEPSNPLLILLNDLKVAGFSNIILVNDGTLDTTIFEQTKRDYGVKVVSHDQNLGKGAALKSGFRYVLAELSHSIDYILTMDADGQHLVQDGVALTEASKNHPKSLIIGTRTFGGNVPLRSKFGNVVTRYVLKILSSISLKDTQSGLRLIPLDLAGKLLDLSGDRYEYELECIIETTRMGIDIQQIPISTIYVEDNTASHFRPLLDSMRIYAIFARFALNSAISFAIDITVFSILYLITSSIYASTYSARTLSATVNFLVNKHVVFKAGETGRITREIFGYVAIAAFVASVSAASVSYLANWFPEQVIPLKIFVDTTLFLVSFLSQKFLLFRRASHPRALT